VAGSNKFKKANKEETGSVMTTGSKYKVRQEQMRAHTSYHKRRGEGKAGDNNAQIEEYEKNLKAKDDLQSIIT
jgi:hypothetical protein